MRISRPKSLADRYRPPQVVRIIPTKGIWGITNECGCYAESKKDNRRRKCPIKSHIYGLVPLTSRRLHCSFARRNKAPIGAAPARSRDSEASFLPSDQAGSLPRNRSLILGQQYPVAAG